MSKPFCMSSCSNKVLSFLVMKLFLLVFIYVVVPFGAFVVKAQQTPISDIVIQPKWEVGTDLLWLIDKNTLPKYSLLIRRQIGQHGAVRFRGGYLKNSTQPHLLSENNQDEATLIRVGYEYQKKLSIKSGPTKSLVYTGIDVFFRYQFNSFLIQNTTLNPGQITNIRVNEVTRDRGGTCFIGFKYFMTSYLSLSAESSFQLSSLYFSQAGSAAGFSSEINYTVGSYQFLPLNTVNLSFHF